MKISIAIDQDSGTIGNICSELTSAFPGHRLEYSIYKETTERLRQKSGESFSKAITNIGSNEVYLWLSRISSPTYLRFLIAHESGHILQKMTNGPIYINHWPWLMDEWHYRKQLASFFSAMYARSGFEKEAPFNGTERSIAPAIQLLANVYADVDCNNYLVKTKIVTTGDYIDTISSFAQDFKNNSDDVTKTSLDNFWKKLISSEPSRKYRIAAQAGVLFSEWISILGILWGKLSPIYKDEHYSGICEELILAQIDGLTPRHGSFASWHQLRGNWQRLSECDFDSQKVEQLLKYIAEHCVTRVRELKD